MGGIAVTGTSGAPPPSIWSVVGDRWFHDLVDRFYVGVADDPVLRPMYPDELDAARDHLAAFLIQYWGGPTTYSDERGHPRLRMRHVPFTIDAAARDAWLRCMLAAVRAGDLSAEHEAAMVSYFEMAATHLINADD